MKYILSILSASLLILSCDQIDNPTPINTIDDTKTATISGLVTAELDNTVTGREKATVGTVLLFTVNASDYTAVTSTGTQKLVYTASVDANGAYSVSIPALNKEITVTVTGDDFAFEQRLTATTTARTIYKLTAPGTSPKILLGKKTILDLQYNP